MYFLRLFYEFQATTTELETTTETDTKLLTKIDKPRETTTQTTNELNYDVGFFGRVILICSKLFHKRHRKASQALVLVYCCLPPWQESFEGAGNGDGGEPIGANICTTTQ